MFVRDAPVPYPPTTSVPQRPRDWLGLLLYGLFFLTPVFYTSDLAVGVARRLLAVNPLAFVIDATRAAMIAGSTPFPRHAGAFAGALALALAAALVSYEALSRGVSERL